MPDGPEHDITRPTEVEPVGVSPPARVGARRAPYIIGIGASAGGLRPLEQFFGHMPPGSGVAFVVIQHLSPDFKSLMRELLSRHTQMKVVRVEGPTPIEPDSLYLIPPRKNMTLRDGVLQLEDQDLTPGHRLNFPIDVFFQSLATDMGDRAIGVVLSGTGSDGSRGIRDISEAGGLVLVQHPDSAEFDGMPRSAINTNLAHVVESPDQIARTIYEYITRNDDHGYDRAPLPPGLREPERLSEVAEVLGSEEGPDFTHYKHSTLARRIARRMLIGGSETLDDYLKMLSESEQEREALRNDLLIGVTAFFRDRPAWERLEREVIPTIIESAGDELRVWVTACSSGEEVYSLAMLLHERLADMADPPDLKIFATDIDRRALERASAGIYDENVVADVGEARLERFFEQRGDQYAVRRLLREHIIFSPHNLLRDAPFTKLDLVTCRNVLIYMEPELQQRVIATLHFGLRHKGALMLGAAESLGDLADEFGVVSKRWKIYRKSRDIALPLERRRPLLARRDVRTSSALVPHASRTDLALQGGLRSLMELLDGMCLILGPDLSIQHAFGRTDLYLAFPQGEGTTDVTKLIAHDLVLPIRTGTHRAQSSEEPVAYDAIPVTVGGKKRLVNLRIEHKAERRGAGTIYVVFVAEAGEHTPGLAGSGFDPDTAAADRIHLLERELQHTRENLQATIEELETTNEEQQASNEELLASNEELQSTNEELHSVNEELYTVNAEYQQKIQELTELNNDLDNLIASTEIGVVFLDEDLCIRRFTPAVSRLLRIRAGDIGRPIGELSAHAEGLDLTRCVSGVVESGRPFEQGFDADDGSRILLRINPYVANGDRVRGAVLTTVDITQLREIEQLLRESEEHQRELYQRTPMMLCSVDARHRVLTVSDDWCRRLGYVREEAVGRRLVDFFDDESRKRALEEVLPAFASSGVVQEVPYRIVTASGDARDVVLSATAQRARSGEIERAAVVMVDVTERNRAVAELSLSEERYRTLIRSSTSIFWSTDPDGRVAEPNPDWERFSGQRASEYVGTIDGWADRAHPDDRVRVLDAWADARATTPDVFRERFRVYHARTGKYRWVECVGAPRRRAEGGIGEWIGAATDVDVQVRSQADLARVNEELRIKNREMEEFVYTISHDLKSPLVTISGMVGYLRRLLDEGNRDKAEELMRTVEETALRMREKIDNLLDLSRLGRAMGERTDVPLRDVLIETLHEHRADLRARGVTPRIPDDLPMVRADRHQLQRAIDNLVSNAIRYGLDADRPALSFESEADASAIRFCVRDNGGGIDHRHHERVFRLFTRVAAEGDGAGVGLALVKRVMDQHNGGVWVESAPGNGAAFWLEFPVVEREG